MREFLINYQTNILMACGIFSILLAFFVMVIKFQSTSKKMALIKIQLGVAILMITDSVYYMFSGDGTSTALIVMRAMNFIGNSMILANIYFLNQYITALFMGSGKFDKVPKRILASFILPSVGFTLIVINEFNGMFYYFDDVLGYQRGPIFSLCYLVPVVTIILMFSFVVQYRKMLTRGIFFAVVIFSFLPLIATVAQIYFYGISLITLSVWQAAVTLFWFALVDQNDELIKAANTEIATGLPNTYGYFHEVDKIINLHDITQYNGYYFDIVRMSQVNNRFGKQKGDQVIIDYARYIKKRLDKDEILGRLGGNFFVALVKKEHTEDFLKLLRDVPVEVELDGKKETLHLAAVAGGYEADKRTKAAGQIISNCAAALSYAKNIAHKPYVFLDADLEEEFKRIRTLEENARKALADGDFYPYYQPKVDVNENKMIGAEALVRWHKDGRVVFPNEFISTMEKNGSICDLDFYILERVCQDIKEWLDKGIEPVQVSVNFSRRNLSNDFLTEKITSIIERYDIPKKYIQIEITETVDEYSVEALYDLVEKLHLYGVSSAIDDFGTGSSSIKLMKEVPFDVLKIDKTFVDYENFKEKQLLYDIIQMAENIGVEVVAEGVEKRSQIVELKKMGCTMIQGFVFDRAMEKSLFEKKLLDKRYE